MWTPLSFCNIRLSLSSFPSFLKMCKLYFTKIVQLFPWILTKFISNLNFENISLSLWQTTTFTFSLTNNNLHFLKQIITFTFSSTNDNFHFLFLAQISGSAPPCVAGFPRIYYRHFYWFDHFQPIPIWLTMAIAIFIGFWQKKRPLLKANGSGWWRRTC